MEGIEWYPHPSSHPQFFNAVLEKDWHVVQGRATVTSVTSVLAQHLQFDKMTIIRFSAINH